MVNPVVGALDIDEIAEHVDLNAIIDRVNVNELLDRVEAGVVPQGARVVLTVTGHGLKDPQWALRAADGSDIRPTVVEATTSEVASVLGLVPVGAGA